MPTTERTAGSAACPSGCIGVRCSGTRGRRCGPLRPIPRTQPPSQTPQDAISAPTSKRGGEAHVYTTDVENGWPCGTLWLIRLSDQECSEGFYAKNPYD